MLHPPQTGPDALWKRRFAAYGVVAFQLAPAQPARGLAISMSAGYPQAQAWDVPHGTLRPVGPPGVFEASLTPTGSHIFYLHDPAGAEIGHYMRLPWTGGAAEDVTPDLPPYSAIYRTAISAAGNLFAFTASDERGCHLTCVPLGADGRLGAPRRLFTGSKLAQDVTLSHDGDVAVIASTERTAARQYGLLAFDTAGPPLAELWEAAPGSLRPVRFAPHRGDSRLLAHSDCSGTIRPLLWDPRAGTRVDFALPTLEGDVYPLDWAPDGARFLLCQVYRAEQQLYLYEPAADRLTRLDHPPGVYDVGAGPGTCFGPDGAIFALWETASHPPAVVVLDGVTGRLARTLLAPADLPPGHALRSVSFRSSDGTEAQGWLGVPDSAGPFPTILDLHGGPHFHHSDMFNPLLQSWIDHGFACLTLNYRGSTGFGRAFQQQIWGDLGHWEVEDIVAARQWLVAQGIAQPDAVLLTGASYGGYLTLQALGKYPDLWAGGLAIAADADLTISYADSSETFRSWIVAMMGGRPDEKPAAYAAASPLTYADRVRAPVLIIQGRNDTRCPPRSIEVYEAQLRARGQPITVEWYTQGHGSVGMDQLKDFQERLLQAAYEWLNPGAAPRPS